MEIKKIIVSRTDKIGDLVLSIPSFYMLRKMYPEAEITVLVRNYNYDIVKNLPYISIPEHIAWTRDTFILSLK